MDSRDGAHTFVVRGEQFAVQPFTGNTCRAVDGAAVARGGGPEVAGHLFRTVPRARRQKRWCYRVQWDDAHVALHSSVFCNMACRYCQAADARRTSKHPAMDVQTAREAMDFAVFEFAERAPNISFSFGISGEPLLAWDLFLALHDYGRQLATQTGKAITWGINTNGLLLDDGIVSALEERPDVVLAISIDGPPEAHDAMRRTPGGRTTHDDAARAARRVLASEHRHLALTNAVATLTAAFPHPHSVLEHLVELGFRRVAIKPVRVDRARAFALNPDTLPLFQEGYSTFADFLYTDLTRHGGETYGCLLGTDPFITTLRRVVRNRGLPLRCPAGRNMIAIGPDGNIYPCDATMGYGDVLLGDIRNGIESCAQSRVIHCYVDKRDACSTCWARLICGGECHHVALLAGGFDVVDESYCGLVRHMIEQAIWLAAAVKDHSPDAYGRMLSTLGIPRVPTETTHDLQGTRAVG